MATPEFTRTIWCVLSESEYLWPCFRLHCNSLDIRSSPFHTRFPFRPASSSYSIISYSHFQSERIAKSNSIANETHLEIALRNHPSTPSAEAQKEPFWNATLPGSLCKHLPYRIPGRWLIVVLSWWFVGKIQRHQNEILIWSAAPLLVHILYNATPSMTSTMNEGTICGRKKR